MIFSCFTELVPACTTYKYHMYQSSLWPKIPGVTIITELAEDHYYMIPRSQYLVFPFMVKEGQEQIRIDAGHSSFYSNQQGSITAWASDQVIGRSITGEYNSNLSSIRLLADGYSWLFHDLNVKPDFQIQEPVYNQELMFSELHNFYDESTAVKLVQWIYPNQTYFMCFQNKENKDNGLFAKFTYMSL